MTINAALAIQSGGRHASQKAPQRAGNGPRVILIIARGVMRKTVIMPKPRKHPAYLARLAEQPCLVTGKRGVECHHLTRLTPMNLITRNDRYAVPLSPEVHRFGKFAVHEMGVSKFEAHWHTDLTAAANWLWRQWENG